MNVWFIIGLLVLMVDTVGSTPSVVDQFIDGLDAPQVKNYRLEPKLATMIICIIIAAAIWPMVLVNIWRSK